MIVNRNADFFYKTNRIDSIHDSNGFEWIRIANRNVLVARPSGTSAPMLDSLARRSVGVFR